MFLRCPFHGNPGAIPSPPGTCGTGGVCGPGGDEGDGVLGAGCCGTGPARVFSVTGVVLHPATRIRTMRITAAAGNPDLMDGISAAGWYL